MQRHAVLMLHANANANACPAAAAHAHLIHGSIGSSPLYSLTSRHSSLWYRQRRAATSKRTLFPLDTQPPRQSIVRIVETFYHQRPKLVRKAPYVRQLSHAVEVGVNSPPLGFECCFRGRVASCRGLHHLCQSCLGTALAHRREVFLAQLPVHGGRVALARPLAGDAAVASCTKNPQKCGEKKLEDSQGNRHHHRVTWS